MGLIRIVKGQYRFRTIPGHPKGRCLCIRPSGANTSERYSRRFEMLIPALREIRFDAVKPKASFYCYVRAPKGSSRGLSFKNAEEAASYLVKEALISTVPWDEAGPYLRLAVTLEAESIMEEAKVIMEVKRRLLEIGLYFE